jgi:hypothetical protein
MVRSRGQWDTRMYLLPAERGRLGRQAQGHCTPVLPRHHYRCNEGLRHRPSQRTRVPLAVGARQPLQRAGLARLWRPERSTCRTGKDDVEELRGSEGGRVSTSGGAYRPCVSSQSRHHVAVNRAGCAEQSGGKHNVPS